ncbi:MAG: rod shape-determining protein RodA [Bacteroidota bacterium]
MRKERSFLLWNIDWMTFSLYLSLVAIGWMMIYAVGYDEQNPTGFFDLSTNIGKQSLWIGLSIAVLAVTFIIDWKFWWTFAYPIFSLSMLLLLGVLFFGLTIKGAKSWYSFAGFTLQPSEFAKFATCLAISAYLSTYSTSIKEIRSQLTIFGIIALPILLILLQPDAGSALVFTSFLIVLFREGLSANLYILGFTAAILLILGLVFDPFLVLIGLILLIILVFIFNLKTKGYWLLAFALLTSASILAINQGFLYYVLGVDLLAMLGAAYFQWRQRKGRLVTQLMTILLIGGGLTFLASLTFDYVLREHQQDRINVWLRPSVCDPQGSLYNVLQSKMAIGSGGLQGKGFLQGTMTKLNYVPEQVTDFIFCTIGEEQGFIGSVGIIGLFLLLLIRITTIAERQRSEFSRIYAYCVAGVIFVHFFVNIGMTMGLMPIIGIPLPFISKGGSSLLGFTLMIGVLLKLDSRRLSS